MLWKLNFSHSPSSSRKIPAYQGSSVPLLLLGAEKSLWFLGIAQNYMLAYIRFTPPVLCSSCSINFQTPCTITRPGEQYFWGQHPQITAINKPCCSKRGESGHGGCAHLGFKSIFGVNFHQKLCVHNVLGGCCRGASPLGTAEGLQRKSKALLLGGYWVQKGGRGCFPGAGLGCEGSIWLEGISPED